MVVAAVNDPPKGSSKRSWFLFGIAVAAIAYVTLLMPASTCEGLVPDVVKLSKDNAGPLQARVIDIVEIKTVSADDGELFCSGLGILSNTMKQQINFEYSKEYDKWWIKFESQGLPF